MSPSKDNTLEQTLALIAALMVPIPIFIKVTCFNLAIQIPSFIEGILVAFVGLGITALFFQLLVLERYKEIEEKTSIATVKSLLVVYQRSLLKELEQVCNLNKECLQSRASKLGKKGVQAITRDEADKALFKMAILDTQTINGSTLRRYKGLVSEYQRMMSVLPSMVFMVKLNTDKGQQYCDGLLVLIKHDVVIQKTIQQCENLEFSLTSSNFQGSKEECEEYLLNAVFAMYANIIYVIDKASDLVSEASCK